jgi:hypothetical protein
MKILEYLAFRVFEFFLKKDSKMAKTNTINFIALLVGSFLFTLFLILNGIFHFYSTPETPNPRMKYYIGIPFAVILITASSLYLKEKLSDTGFDKLKARYSEKWKNIPIWLIFILPIILVFFTPILYGWINGTLSFPIFEK